MNVLDYSMTFTVEIRGNYVKFGCDNDEFQIPKPGALDLRVRTREFLQVGKSVFGTCRYVRAMLYKSDIDLSCLQGCTQSFTGM